MKIKFEYNPGGRPMVKIIGESSAESLALNKWVGGEGRVCIKLPKERNDLYVNDIYFNIYGSFVPEQEAEEKKASEDDEI